MNKQDFIKKHVSNTRYGKEIMRSESERLTHFLADRAAQYSMDADEIEARLYCFFPDEFINRVCVLTQQIYETLEGDQK